MDAPREGQGQNGALRVCFPHDEIVAHLAAQLDSPLASAEAQRAERSPHPDSVDFYFRGEACLNNGNDPARK